MADRLNQCGLSNTYYKNNNLFYSEAFIHIGKQQANILHNKNELPGGPVSKICLPALEAIVNLGVWFVS